jgi:hypothetical protein
MAPVERYGGLFMKCPLILSADDGAHIFQAEDDLIRDVEAIDVDNAEYVVYDSEGRLLALATEKPSGAFSRLRHRKVVLRESGMFKKEELRRLLIDHLERLGKRQKDDRQLDLNQLIQRVAEAGGRRIVGRESKPNRDNL